MPPAATIWAASCGTNGTSLAILTRIVWLVAVRSDWRVWVRRASASSGGGFPLEVLSRSVAITPSTGILLL